MDFLRLCQRVVKEAGLSETGPTQVTGQTGDLQRVIDWVQDGWLQLQYRRDKWEWLWNDGAIFTMNSAASVREYNLTSFGVRTLIDGTVYIDDGMVEAQLIQLSHSAFARRFRLSAGDSWDVGQPTHYAVTPSGMMVFNTIPDQDYQITAEYYRHPTAFVDGTDLPTGLPEGYHLIIVWAALQQYGIYDEASEAFQRGKLNYEMLLSKLESEALPQITMAGPLA